MGAEVNDLRPEKIGSVGGRGIVGESTWFNS